MPEFPLDRVEARWLVSENFRLKITHERHSPFVKAKKAFARSKTKIRQFSKPNIRFADKEL
jgi:hypothetical protein